MKNKYLITALLVIILYGSVYSQEPYRVGTTTANFLEIGYGGAACGMGDAYVAILDGDLSSLYWNPAGLAYAEKSQAFVSIQPWYVDINTNMIGLSFGNSYIGNFALSIVNMDYGQEEVTTVRSPNGTGEKYDGSDLSFNLTYSRKLADWFSFGFTAKYITSQIWEESASAIAMDLGAIVNTQFFKWSDNPGDGLNIGMSISNYGTQMTYDGKNLKQYVDLEPDEDGNFAYVGAKFETNEWELPLLFRLGISFYPYKSDYHSIVVAVDAIHPNNNSESINIGCQYTLIIPSYGEVYLRGGYKGLFMNELQYGPSFGIGANIKAFGNQSVKFDYAYRTHEVLGSLNSISVGFLF